MNTEMIKQVVEEHFKIQLNSKTRRREYVEARAIYYKLLRDNTRMSLANIGKTMGRDHATVLHSVRRVDDWIKYDKQIRLDYNTLNDRVQHAIRINPELLNQVTTIEGFYEVEYKKIEAEHNNLLINNTKEYKDLVNRYNFLKSALQVHQPKRIASGEFDLV